MGEISGWDISSARRPSGPGEWSAPSRLAPCSSRLRARALELESGRCRRLRKNQTTAEVNDHCDLTPTAERRHHTGAPRRHLLIGNIGSGGRQRQAPGRGTGTTQSSFAPIPQSQFTRAVRRITGATRQGWSRRKGVCDDFRKPCSSSSGCESRPAKGEPARAGSEPCAGTGNGSGDA